MTAFLISLGAAGGFALCWFAKDKIIALVTGTEALATSLEAKAKALRAAL
jgi:hypothetical protein